MSEDTITTPEPDDVPKGEASPETSAEQPVAPFIPPSDQDIADAQKWIDDTEILKKDYEELKRKLSDNTHLATAFKEAVQPLVPKPEVKHPWDSDDWLNDPKMFRETLVALMKHQMEQELNPLKNSLGQISQTLPIMYARSAVDPNFNTIQSKAAEYMKAYGVDQYTAIRIAQDQYAEQQKVAQAQARKAPPQVPSTASAPKGKAKASKDLSKYSVREVLEAANAAYDKGEDFEV